MADSLQKKVERAIKLIQAAGKIAKEHRQPLEVGYSGGKDSDVILELTKMSGVDYVAIYHNTTIDPSGTIKHAEQNGAVIVRPKETFFQLIAKKGNPSRFSRFCCKYLKEHKTYDYVVLGIRREESKKRAERYKEPEQCRVYSKTEKVRQYFHILDWSAEDVLCFIKERKIKLHPLYYTNDGDVDVTRRLGCLCCPLQGRRSRIQAFQKYPNMVKAYIRALSKFRATHPNSKAILSHTDVYAQFVHDVFYSDNQSGWVAMNNGILPPPYIKIFWRTFSI